MRIGIIAGFALLCLACGQPETSGTVQRLIPDIDSLMAIGAAERVSVTKASVLNEVRSSGTYPATKGLSEELAVFSAVESMNRPVFQDRYRRSTRPDDKSNLMITEWIATDSSAQVQTFRLYRHDSLAGIIRMEAEMRDNSLFFSKQERLAVDFDPWSGRPEQYEASGRQQIAWLKPDVYEVRAKIIHKH